MKIIVIGASGTIGSAVADALAARGHEVLRASRSGQVQVDVDDVASIDAMFAKVDAIDAVVSCANGTPAKWQALFRPVDQIAEAQLSVLFDGIRARVHFIQVARRHVKQCIVMTTGALSQHPVPGSAAISMMAAGTEAFVKGVALEPGTRINCVAPPWVKETMEKMGMDSATGLPAAALAESYVKLVEGTQNGVIEFPVRG